MLACGEYHTVSLSNDGILHSFGRNAEGQLGLGHHYHVSIPTPIPNLPKINLISCGQNFTVCVDCEGFLWSFGANTFGQLGTGNAEDLHTPQKILKIPPVVSVSCGAFYTLIITNDSNLWSCGANPHGQLCFGATKSKNSQSTFQQTPFSNILKISTGHDHSLFQNNKGEIFACGYNKWGQCALGHFIHPLLTPTPIHNLPPNIAQFICGYHHSLFLDSEGNVYSVGQNSFGTLGLGHYTHQNVLNKIPNIPPIKIISCVGASCYLIDFEGNLWSFGLNQSEQLGRGIKQLFPK